MDESAGHISLALFISVYVERIYISGLSQCCLEGIQRKNSRSFVSIFDASDLFTSFFC